MIFSPSFVTVRGIEREFRNRQEIMKEHNTKTVQQLIQMTTEIIKKRIETEKEIQQAKKDSDTIKKLIKTTNEFIKKQIQIIHKTDFIVSNTFP